jgi:hypothetical protein
MGNIIDSNLGFATLASNALLVTDTTAATFWITNPNNTVTNNRAAGAQRPPPALLSRALIVGIPLP